MKPGMRAMVLEQPATALHLVDLPKPRPGKDAVLIQVEACGECRFCINERENLCDAARLAGYQINGGYAEYTVADARYCFPLPSRPIGSPQQAALDARAANRDNPVPR